MPVTPGEDRGLTRTLALGVAGDQGRVAVIRTRPAGAGTTGDTDGVVGGPVPRSGRVEEPGPTLDRDQVGRLDQRSLPVPVRPGYNPNLG